MAAASDVPLTPLNGSEPIAPVAGVPLTSEMAYEKAWKYVGYRGFSQFLGSHENFLQIRLYRALNSRVILAMQDYIAELESKLQAVEAQLCRPTASDDVHNGSYRYETSTERFNLVWEIQKRLKDYNDYILTYSQLARRDRVDGRDTRSVKNWLASWPGAIRDEEVGYLDEDDDLIYATEKIGGSLGRTFRKLAVFVMPCFLRPPKKGEFSFVMSSTILHESGRVDKFLVWTVMMLGLAMLVVPLWLLHLPISSDAKLAIITGCIFIFLISISLVTSARPFESLGATAAYAAVLVVFLQAGT